MSRSCAKCSRTATCYAMDTCPGGWADFYCYWHQPEGWVIEQLPSSMIKGGKS